MMEITRINTKALCEKYLGFPTAVGRSMKEAFEHIPARVCGLMGGWSENMLSAAAKETLIKSIV
jgi:hypothetical protein